MHNPLQKMKQTILQLEYVSGEIAQKYDIEDLKGPQGMVLYYLSKHQEEEIFVKDIEKKLKISKSVASNLVKRMEKNGFINLQISSKDKRYKQVIITDKGISKIKPLEHFHKELLEHLFVDISMDDLKTVNKVMQQLLMNVENYNGEKDGKKLSN